MTATAPGSRGARLRPFPAWPRRLLVVLAGMVLATACTHDIRMCGPCVGGLAVDIAGLIRPSEQATGLRVCLTVRTRTCYLRSISHLRSGSGPLLIIGGDGIVVHHLAIEVIKENVAFDLPT